MKEIIVKHLKFILPCIALIMILTILYITKTEKTNNIIEQEPLLEEKMQISSKQESQEDKKIKVDIKGEIKNPGVYELKENDRVSDAIKVSGGLTENADTTLINLSKNLKDEMVIIIYNKYEIEKLRQDSMTTKTIVEYIEKGCSCPDTINDACISKNTESTNTDINSKIETTKDNKISLNKATQEELLTLPGIGESKAKAIIKYREENNGFKSIDEIKNISGIGESTFEKFKDYISI